MCDVDGLHNLTRFSSQSLDPALSKAIVISKCSASYELDRLFFVLSDLSGILCWDIESAVFAFLRVVGLYGCLLLNESL